MVFPWYSCKLYGGFLSHGGYPFASSMCFFRLFLLPSLYWGCPWPHDYGHSHIICTYYIYIYTYIPTILPWYSHGIPIIFLKIIVYTILWSFSCQVRSGWRELTRQLPRCGVWRVTGDVAPRCQCWFSPHEYCNNCSSKYHMPQFLGFMVIERSFGEALCKRGWMRWWWRPRIGWKMWMQPKLWETSAGCSELGTVVGTVAMTCSWRQLVEKVFGIPLSSRSQQLTLLCLSPQSRRSTWASVAARRG